MQISMTPYYKCSDHWMVTIGICTPVHSITVLDIFQQEPCGWCHVTHFHQVFENSVSNTVYRVLEYKRIVEIFGKDSTRYCSYWVPALKKDLLSTSFTTYMTYRYHLDLQRTNKQTQYQLYKIHDLHVPSRLTEYHRVPVIQHTCLTGYQLYNKHE